MHDAAVLHLALDEPARIHWAVVEVPAPPLAAIDPPTIAELVGASFASAVQAGSILYDSDDLRLRRERRVRLGPLRPRRAYDVYAVAVDVARGNAQAAPTTLELVAAQPRFDDGEARRLCRERYSGYYDARLGARQDMTVAFYAWVDANPDLTPSEIDAEQTRLNTLFATCQRADKNPERRFYDSGGDGELVYNRVGLNRMVM